MLKMKIIASLITLAAILIWILILPAVANDVPRLTKEEVKTQLGNPGVAIIDVRAGGVQPGDPKVLGAIVEDPKKFEQWAKDFSKNQMLILYCS